MARIPKATKTDSASATPLDEKLSGLPDLPGVYIFLGATGKTLYIGKAKSLRKRVRSYFQKQGTHDIKTARLVSLIRDCEIILTNNEMEALILEANLVKERRPRYNLDLKDDKRYPYIQVTLREPFPRLLVARRVVNDGSRYFGPYTDATSMRRTLRFIGHLFKIRTCSLVIPAPSGKPYRVCLEYHIGRCGGPCEGLQSAELYRDSIHAVIMFLSGRSLKLLSELQDRMKEAALAENFERAAELRDQISALETVRRKQKIVQNREIDRDIVAIALAEGEGLAVILQIRDGIMIGRQNVRISSGDLTNEVIVAEELTEQYYSRQPDIPSEIHLPVSIPGATLIAEWLSAKRGSKVALVSPGKGEDSLMAMAQANARLSLEELLIQKRGYRERPMPTVADLHKALGLPRSPERLCCFDVSNTGATDAVGAMSYFLNGRPQKSEYRHFTIKTVRGQDDFAMMREIVGRYFFRLQKEKKAPPDLVVIDGGRGHLNAATAELRSLGIQDQPIIGLAKKLEEIYFPDRDQPITLRKDSPALGLLRRVRDEAHRFGVNHNRLRRAKRTITSALDTIPGVGPTRRNALLKKLGSVSKIRAASAVEIAETPGVSPRLAQTILDTLSRSPL